MHHATLTAQQRTQYLSAREHQPRMPAHVALNRLRRFRLWYSAGAAMYPYKVPSVRQCVVTRALGEFAARRRHYRDNWALPWQSARATWHLCYSAARRAMR